MTVGKMNEQGLDSIFGKDDPILRWIQEQVANGKTLEQIKTDYKAFHILKDISDGK